MEEEEVVVVVMVVVVDDDDIDVQFAWVFVRLLFVIGSLRVESF